MTFLTRYRLSHRDCLKMRLTNTYEVHKAVYSLFPKGEDNRILYADKGFRDGWRHILILSGIKPETEDPNRVDFRPVPEKFLDFPGYVFDVEINAVRRQNATGKLEAIGDRDDIRGWFEERAPTWGFAARSVQVGQHWADIFYKSRDKRVTLAKASLSGILEVRDRDVFKRSFRNGIGRGKAFGCGLLQLRPLQ